MLLMSFLCLLIHIYVINITSHGGGGGGGERREIKEGGKVKPNLVYYVAIHSSFIALSTAGSKLLDVT